MKSTFSLLLLSVLLVAAHGWPWSKKNGEASGGKKSWLFGKKNADDGGEKSSLLQNVNIQEKLNAPLKKDYKKDDKYDEMANTFLEELQGKHERFNDAVKKEQKENKDDKDKKDDKEKKEKSILDEVSYETKEVYGFDKGLKLSQVKGADKDGKVYINALLTTGKIGARGVVKYKSDIKDKSKYFTVTAKELLSYEIRLKITLDPYKNKVFHLEKVKPKGPLTVTTDIDGGCDNKIPSLLNKDKTTNDICKAVDDYINKTFQEEFEEQVQKRFLEILEGF